MGLKPTIAMVFLLEGGCQFKSKFMTETKEDSRAVKGQLARLSTHHIFFVRINAYKNISKKMILTDLSDHCLKNNYNCDRDYKKKL